MFSSWWRGLTARGNKSGTYRRGRSRSRGRLWAETLEDRVVPASSAYFSMPTNLAANQGTTITVPVSINNLTDTSGNLGLNSADVVLTYDPTVFSVGSADVTQGSLLTNAPPNGTWAFTPNASTPGEIDISLFSSDLGHDVTTSAGGVLANIQFHVKGSAPTGSSTIHVVVPPATSPSNGLSSDATPHSGPDSIQGAADGYTLSPADQQDGVINVQNFAPISTLSVPTNVTAMPGGTVTVAVNVSNPDPNGSAGMTSADAAILFDPAVLSVAATGAVAAGSVVPTSGWNAFYGVDTTHTNPIDSTKDTLGLHLVNTNGTPLTSTTAGSLWLVTFNVVAGASGTTILNLVPSVQVGSSTTSTNVTGANKVYQLTPAPTNATTDAVDGSVTVSAVATATHFSVSGPSTATAGTPVSFTVTALDASNNPVSGYTGMVHFTSSDGQAVLPADATLTNGTGTFNVTFHTSGSQTLTATDTVISSITGTSGPVTVSATAATHFSVTAPATATAGSAFSFTVTALDAFNNTASGYTGTVHFTSSDGQAVLPANSTLTNGTGTFNVTLKTAGNQTLTATDTVTSTITGTSAAIAVSAAAATHFSVTAPSSATAGSAFNFTVTAQDAFNNIATGYTGTVHFTSSDGQATLPANGTLTSGTGTFSATLKTSGSQTLTATDTVTSTITGTSAAIAVSAAAATHFTVTAPATATAGSAFTFTVTALDAFNNTATGYTGMVHFTSTDSQAVLPADATLTNGTGTFTVTLKTTGNQTLTATDTVTSTITGTSAAIAVSAAAATHFTVTAPATATAGSAFSVTVTALDAFNNTASGYTGTVHFTSSDGQAVLPANSTLTNGTGTFNVTLKTAGNQTLTATDTVTSTITGTSAAIAVSAAAATHFSVTAPATATAGSAFTFTVTAQDAFNNTASGYSGTVHFTSTDATATLPANSTLTNGVGTFSATLHTAGSQTITATDTVTSTITGTSNAINVGTFPATHFAVSAPSSATAGTAFSFTVTALDASNNPTAGYSGTVHFTSSDGQAVLPADATLTNGVGTFTVTLKTAGNQTITATDTVTSSITGTSAAIAVSAAAATHFTVTAPATATAGTAFNFMVTALDAFNNTATGYTGMVHFTSTDSQAVLPTDATLTSGTGTFSATLKTAGSQTLIATDTVTSSITGSSNSIAVSAAAASHFSVTAPSSATAGSAFSVTVTALDAFNNTATGYTGTVHFTSSDSTAVLPANSTLTNGVGTFNVTLKTAGSQTLTATDTVTSTITGTSAAIAVSAAAATHFSVSAPATATAGSAFSFTVTALDAFNNTATGYTGTVHFTSSDGQAVLPTDSPLTSGTGTFNATLKTSGNQTLTATDTVTSTITGTSAAIAVSAAAATHFTVTAPATATAGTAFNFTVTALDAFNNTATGYTGMVHFTSTDSQAVLPADATLTSGTGTFSATLKTSGSQTLIATDTVTSTITGSSNSIAVSAAAASHFSVTAPSSATAGSAFSVTVTALDAFNNTATGYSGTVHFTSSDGQAVLPANSTLTNGVGTFNVTLQTAGNQTITATDTVTSTITGTSAAIAVSAATATHFSVTAPATATAGSAFSFTVTALDAFNNTASGYTGTVHFTSSDGQAVLPTDSPLTSGVGTFNATLKTAGSQTLTATDTVTSTITGTSAAVTVSAAAATHFSVTAPSSATTGGPFSVTVTARDAFNNTASGYLGTVHFTTTDSGSGAAVPADYTFVAGDNGAHTFTNGVTLVTAGSQSVTATDTVTSSITGSATITVSAVSATHFSVSGPATATAGTAVSFTVTALDASNNPVSGYTGMVHFTSSDGHAVLPADATLTNGTGTFNVTFQTAGSQTLTATDTVTSSITGTSGPVTVSAAAATHFAVSAPATANAGSAFTFTVTALDAFNNAATGYTGTVHFTSSDGQAVLPADSTLTSGVGTFSATLKTAGNQTLTATDTVSSSITGTSAAIAVSGVAATHFNVTAPANATAGSAFSFTVTALDPFNNTDTDYTGTVHFTSSDGQAVLPADSTLTNGVGTFNATLKTAGSQTLTATDTVTSTITGTSAAVTVSAAAATHFSVSAPSNATTGGPFSVTVTAQDAFNNTATGYLGTVHFTTTDSGSGAAVPADYTFVAGDNGVHTFTNGVTLVTAGSQSVTATDTVTSSITGSATITVSAVAATHFSVSGPATATAGTAVSFTVTALDASNNPVSGYTGMVHFTSSDGQAVLPADATLTNGTGTFNVTFQTAGSQTLTATDTVTSSITGTSGPVTVSAAAVTHFAVSAPATATAGSAFNFTVTALDQFNNTDTGYTGTVHFTSSDGQAVLPADSTLTNGAGTFSVTLKTAGSQTLTATDTVTSSITGTSAAITVSAAAATHFAVTAPSNATAGSAFSFTVTALDPFNNTDTGYTGTVHFTSSDGQAVLPADSTLTSGTGTFNATLKTAGSQTLTATDTVTSTITGTSAAISVSAAAATHLSVSAPSNATTGAPFSVTVTALDPFNNTDTGYLGTVHFTTTDSGSGAAVPADYTFVAGDNGAHTFTNGVTLVTAGSQSVTATDTVTSSITGSATITVSAVAATHFSVSGPTTATAGVASSFTVTALDASNNPVSGYTGTVHFTSSDGQAVLPANATLTNGVGTFSVTFHTSGSQTLTATDTITSSITGTSAAVAVSAAAATHFSVSASSAATAGSAFSFTVTALDPFNNTATGYTGTVHFTSSDGQAALPADSALISGVGTFSATLKTAGNQTLTATDTVSSSITGSSGTVNVSPAAASHFSVSAPATATAGSAFNFTVTALDAFNNTATGYTGTVHFTSSDTAATLPADATLTSGTGTFSATLQTVGAQTLTATDTVTSSITGTSAAITVSSTNPNTTFLNNAYLDLLGRPIDPAGLSYWSSVLDQGYSRTYVLAGIQASNEYKTDLVTKLFTQLLGRAPDTTDLTNWVLFLNQGGTVEELKAGIMGSAEFLAHNGGTDTGFLQGVYQAALGRSASASELTGWQAELTAGTSLYGVALQILTTPEAYQFYVKSEFASLPHATAPASSASQFVTLLQQGVRDESIVAGIFINNLAGSANYDAITKTVASSSTPPDTGNGFLAQVYQDVLGRAIDATGLASWSPLLDEGISQQDVAADILATPEANTYLVQGLYTQLLGRPADPTGLAGWVGVLAQGGTVEQVKAGIMGTDEFLTHNGGTDTGFLQGVFQAALGRSASASELANWQQLLNAGTSRSSVALFILTSDEAHGYLVQTYYQDLLFRDGQSAEVIGNALALKGIGTDQSVEAAVLGSAEYLSYTDSSTLNNPVLSTESAFLGQLYQDELGRAINASEEAGWSSFLAQGTTRAMVAESVVNSTEAETYLVQGLYQQLLGRPADPTGLAGWVGVLAQGGTVEQVKAGIMGTDEFLAHNGGTDTGFLQGVYQAALGRSASAAELAGWQQQLAAGTSRTSVALQILTTTEARGYLVSSFYQSLLHRAPNPTEQAQGAAALQYVTDQVLETAILSSREFDVNLQ